jgi:hypothetical protein
MSDQHIDWLNNASALIPVHRRESFVARLGEAKRLQETWWHLDRASLCLIKAKQAVRRNDVEEYLAFGEKYLSDLKQNIGEESFALGRMPPPVPYWRFQWID